MARFLGAMQSSGEVMKVTRLGHRDHEVHLQCRAGFVTVYGERVRGATRYDKTDKDVLHVTAQPYHEFGGPSVTLRMVFDYQTHSSRIEMRVNDGPWREVREDGQVLQAQETFA